MALIRWDPNRELQTLQSEMTRLFDAFFGDGAPADRARSRWLPALDLLERENEYVLRVDLPGVRPEDVKVELEDGVLTISGERRAEHEERKEGAYRIERGYGRFVRSVTLPEGVDASKIAARLEDGVLEVHVPKPEDRKPQRIAIDVAKGPAQVTAESANGAAEAKAEEAKAAA